MGYSLGNDSPMNEYRVAYWHPLLDAQKLSNIFPYIERGVERLSNDQLSEIIEVLAMIIDHDAAFENWLSIQQEISRSSRSYSSAINAKQKQKMTPLLNQILSSQLDNCSFSGFDELSENSLVKIEGYINVPRDSKSLKLNIIHSDLSQQRFLLAHIYRTGKDGLPCLLSMDRTWDDQESLSLKGFLFLIPCIVVGKVRKWAEFNLEEKLPLSTSTYALEPYFIFVLPENHRSRYKIFPHQIDEIIYESKQLLSDEQLARWYKRKGNAYATDLVQRNLHLLNKTVEICGVSQSQKGLIQGLQNFFKDKHPVLYAQPLSIIEIISTIDLSIHSLDSINASILILHLLFRLSLESQQIQPLLKNTTVCLCLGRKRDVDGYFKDEGESVYFEIQNQDETNFFDSVNFPVEMDLIDRHSLDLYVMVNETTINLPNRIYKTLLKSKELPDIGGVTWGNTLSSLAIVVVGTLNENLFHELLERVSAIIELEDRPTRTANMPDPWPYNLSKTMKTVTANPNVRYLIIVGETRFCAETTSFLKDKQSIDAIPDTIHIFIPNALVSLFRNQILQSVCLDGRLDEDTILHKRLQRILKTSYLQRTEMSDVSCLPLSIDIANDLTSRNETPTGGIETLIEHFLHEFNKLSGEKVNESELVAQTAKRAQPGLISVVLKYGEQKGPDSHGRFYKDLLSYRATIKDVTSDLILPGANEKQVEKFFRGEWLSSGGLFFSRLTESFGADQIEGCISRIVKTIKDNTVSRSIIMSVSHPNIDQKNPLGVNTIHFSFRQLASKRYQVIGAFEWRTVETLYALPYSMYTTCCFTKFIVDECRRRIGKEYELLYGESIFLALNLHVYLDDLNYDITRLIIEDSLAALTNNTSSDQPM